MLFSYRNLSNKDPTKKNLKIVAVICRKHFCFSPFLCFAHTLWLGLLSACSGRRHSSAATRGLRVLNVWLGSGHVTPYWQPNRGKLVRGITFPVLSPQVPSSTVSCLVLSCLVLFTLVLSCLVVGSVFLPCFVLSSTVVLIVLPCLPLSCLSLSFPFWSSLVLFCFIPLLRGISLLY